VESPTNLRYEASESMFVKACSVVLGADAVMPLLPFIPRHLRAQSNQNVLEKCSECFKLCLLLSCGCCSSHWEIQAAFTSKLHMASYTVTIIGDVVPSTI
jgi:hypothetical protein